MCTRFVPLFLVFVAAVGAEIFPQTVWVVDDTAATGPDFTDLQMAIDTVADGDVLLVKSGTYAGLEIRAKGLTVVADAGQVPVIDATASLVQLARVRDLAANQQVRLQGLRFLESGSQPALEIKNSLGNLWIENCRMESLANGYGISVFNCDSVALLEVTAIGGSGVSCGDYVTGMAGHGLWVDQGSTVAAYGCAFQGGTGGTTSYSCWFGPWCNPRNGGAGVYSFSSANFVFLSGCDIRGGDTTRAWFDCDFSCLATTGATGLATVSSAYVLDCSLTGGTGVPCSPFDPPPQAEPHYGPAIFLPGRALGITPAAPVREGFGQSFQLTGPPGVPVWMATASKPATRPGIPLVRGTALLSLTPPPSTRFIGVTNATGGLAFTLPAAVLPPGVDSEPTFAQFYYLEFPLLPGGRFVLQSPRVPSAFVLGQGALVTTLDPAF